MAHWKPVAVAFLLAVAASKAGAADPVLIRLLPPDAPVIFGLQVEQVRYSPFGQYLLARMEKEAGLQEFISATGFDPRRDLSEIVGAGRGKQGLVCVRGRFDVAKILAAVPPDAAARSTYRGVTILAGKDPRAAGVAFLDPSLAVAGSGEALQGAIDRWLDGTALPPRLAARATEAGSRYDMWLVATSPAELADRLPAEGAGAAVKGDLMRAIEELIGGIKFGADVSIQGESLLKTDKDAAALADVVRFLASLVQMQGNSPRAARLAEHARRVEIAAEGNRVRLSLTLAEAELEKLFETFAGGPRKQPPAN